MTVFICRKTSKIKTNVRAAWHVYVILSAVEPVVEGNAVERCSTKYFEGGTAFHQI